jgi:hypothetical protein
MSLQLGHVPPSMRTTLRPLSSRYELGGTTSPAMTIRSIRATVLGSRNSLIVLQLQSPRQPPQPRLYHWPPIKAGYGQEPPRPPNGQS